MEIIKILVKDINLFDGKHEANILARYNLSIVNQRTNQQYPEVFVDVLDDETKSDCPKVSAPSNYNGPINMESLQNILSASYKFHTEDGGLLDNFLFFDEAPTDTQIGFEIDESGIPVEVHYMNVAS
ncbi:MAG: hypothetical protein Q8933_14860 [Bacteroidota bacterium]|nr:hypothetical protein [Bacteroidota bacterium]MDP4190895.1 hypothetical protein [Bacteroidota bacterium]MDP4195299.1 hypothetical protein [Bacteroidota bacterium]